MYENQSKTKIIDNIAMLKGVTFAERFVNLLFS